MYNRAIFARSSAVELKRAQAPTHTFPHLLEKCAIGNLLGGCVNALAQSVDRIQANLHGERHYHAIGPKLLKAKLNLLMLGKGVVVVEAGGSGFGNNCSPTLPD